LAPKSIEKLMKSDVKKHHTSRHVFLTIFHVF
jgi:hypothetical protein